MSTTLLQQKKAARANLLAVLVHLEKEIKQLEPKAEKPKRDISTIIARENALSLRKFKKQGLI